MKTAIHEYFNKISVRDHIQEFFADCESVENAAECIIDSYPLPEGLSMEDVVEYIQPWWGEA